MRDKPAMTRIAVYACLSIAMLSAARAENGVASVYRDTVTSTGARWRDGYTIAHKTLPIGAIVKIENKANGRVLYARVGDRGPFKRGRIVDVPPKAESVLGCDGLCDVSVTCIGLC